MNSLKFESRYVLQDRMLFDKISGRTLPPPLDMSQEIRLMQSIQQHRTQPGDAKSISVSNEAPRVEAASVTAASPAGFPYKEPRPVGNKPSVSVFHASARPVAPPPITTQYYASQHPAPPPTNSSVITSNRQPARVMPPNYMQAVPRPYQADIQIQPRQRTARDFEAQVSAFAFNDCLLSCPG